MVGHSQMVATSKIPAFFKFFNPELSSHMVNIPLSFTLYVNGMLPDEALLRDKHGNLWSVKVLKIRNEHFFEEGWAKFIADNAVSLGDFLVFQYDGGNIFDFKLLGPAACEKDSTVACSIEVKEESTEKEEKEVRENKYEEVKEEEIEDEEEAEEEENEADDTEFEEEDDEEEMGVTEQSEKSEQEDDDDDESYEEEEDTKITFNVSKKEAKSSRLNAKRVVTSTSRNVGKATKKIAAGGENTDAYKLEKITDDIFGSGLLPPPIHPYFIARLKPRGRNELYIPQEVITDYIHDIPDEMIICAADGKEFLSRVASWGDGRKILTDGWRAFCRWYFVREQERCLCVFLPDQALQIYVLRLQAGKWTLRPRM